MVLENVAKLRRAEKCLHKRLEIQISRIGDFFETWFAAQNELVGRFDLFPGFVGDLSGEFLDERVVHEKEGLRGDGGDIALAFDLGGAGEVEGAEEFGDVVADDGQDRWCDTGLRRSAGRA
jgi:hypothetical protein